VSSLCKCGCGKPAPLAKKTDARYGQVKGQPKHFVHGHSSFRHGGGRGEGTPEYRAYYNAKERCTNPKGPNWKDYGGRGIKFLFASFQQFLDELGPRPSPQHSLDRWDNDGPYAPGNCRWATKSVQRRNNSLSANSDESLIAECKRRNLWLPG